MSASLSLDNILLKAANDEVYEDFQMAKISCYKNDINFDHLRKQLPLCADLTRQVLPGVKQVTSVHTICEATNTQVYKLMLCEVHNLLRLYLTIPITSATAERSFSALRNVLTYTIYD